MVFNRIQLNYHIIWFSNGPDHLNMGPVQDSGGLNTKHWNTEHFEVLIFNGWVLEWSVIAIAI